MDRWILLGQDGAEAAEKLAEVVGDNRPILEKLQDVEYLKELAIQGGMKLAGAIAIFLIGKLVAKFVAGMFRRLLERSKCDPTLVGFFGNIAYAVLMVIVVMAALDFLGVPVSGVAGVLAGAGLAVALALQGSLGNFASGVMMVFFKPIAVGDLVNAGGTFGVVKEIGLFATIFETPDGKKVIVPNGSITSDNIENFSANGRIRVEMTFGIGYEDDIRAAKDVMMGILKDDPNVLDDPAPTVAVRELADSSVNFAVFPWCKPEHYWDVFFDTHEAIKMALDGAGISIPFPAAGHPHRVVWPTRAGRPYPGSTRPGAGGVIRVLHVDGPNPLPPEVLPPAAAAEG